MKLCEYCMAEFEPKRPDQKYCRPKCAKRYAQFKNFKKAGRIVYTRICPKCGRIFMTIDENKFNCQDCISIDVKERLIKPKKKDDAIKVVNHMARASGMSYGKFVAQMSMKPLERK